MIIGIELLLAAAVIAYGIWIARVVVMPAAAPVTRLALAASAALSVIGLITLGGAACYAISTPICHARMRTYLLTHTLQANLPGRLSDALLGTPLIVHGSDAAFPGTTPVFSVYTAGHTAIAHIDPSLRALVITDSAPASLTWLLGLSRQ